MKRGRSSRGLKNQGGPNLGVEKPLRRSKRLRSSSVAKPAVVERKRSSKSLQKARSSRSKATTRPAYVYEPVDTDVGEIRILTLLPGLASSEIQISLEIDRLSEGEVPQFEALSYVWGSAEHSVEISVFTKGESTTARSLSVTQNLAVALLHLRGEKVPRRLWIDAICVDQRNLGERGRQVERMPEVYRSAERVVVWLGPERESSNLAMAAIRTLSAKVYYDQSTYVIKPFTEADENCASMDQNLQFDHLTMTAITKLFIRPWFERLWVQQEIRFAKDTSVIMCGAECILWPIFHNAMICMCLKPKESPKYSALHNRCNFLLNAFHQNMFDISLKLSMTRLGSCRCLDPRDKIYAVLSLINTKDRNDSFKPDYKKSTAEVYKDFVSMHLQHPHGLNIISMCEITEARNTMLPSWFQIGQNQAKHIWLFHIAIPAEDRLLYTVTGNNTLGIVGNVVKIVFSRCGSLTGLNLSNTGDMESWFRPSERSFLDKV